MAGLGIGAILCFSNMFFGLETGWVTMGSLQSSVLGYALFHSLRRFPLFQDFTPLENVVLQTTAVATGTMPLAGGTWLAMMEQIVVPIALSPRYATQSLCPGFVGIIPALGMLGEDSVQLSMGELLVWAFGVAFFGVGVPAVARA